MIRVVVVDDHPVVRDGVVATLSAAPGLEVVGQAASGPEAVRLTAARDPDVVVMDLRMPGGGGVEAVREMKARGLRAAVLVPWAIPTAVTAKLWFFILAASGILNSLIGQQILWTSDEWPAKFAIIIADVWKTTPFISLLLLSGLAQVPGELTEAARVDGASAWQRLTRVVLPNMKAAIMVAVVFRALDAFRIFDNIFIMTQGQ